MSEMNGERPSPCRPLLTSLNPIPIPFRLSSAAERTAERWDGDGNVRRVSSPPEERGNRVRNERGDRETEEMRRKGTRTEPAEHSGAGPYRSLPRHHFSSLRVSRGSCLTLRSFHSPLVPLVTRMNDEGVNVENERGMR